MAELVALDLPGGPQFVRALTTAWDQGNAVAPLDRRLARPARERLLEALAPSWVVTVDGPEAYPGGVRSTTVTLS